MNEIDLKQEIKKENTADVYLMATEFYACGGALTFDEWSHFHPTARAIFKQARDVVEVDRLRALGHIIRTGR